MKKNKNVFVAKTYKLTKEAAPLSFMLPIRHTKRFPLMWFDEDKGINRELRYSANQKSIYRDEQDENVLLSPVIFEDGFLYVDKTNQILQKFLLYHPLNGKIFIEINIFHELFRKHFIEIRGKNFFLINIGTKNVI